MNYIINPLNNIKLSLFSKNGKKVLKKYVKLFQKGGSNTDNDSEEYHDTLPPISTSILESIENIKTRGDYETFYNSEEGRKIRDELVEKVNDASKETQHAWDKLQEKNLMKVDNKDRKPKCDSYDTKRTYVNSGTNTTGRVNFFTGKGKRKKYLGVVVK